MTKKIITIAVIAAALIGGAYLYKRYGKKPCPCSQNNGSIATAIDKMSEDELRQQIVALGSKVRLDGKTKDELKAILLQLMSNK